MFKKEIEQLIKAFEGIYITLRRIAEVLELTHLEKLDGERSAQFKHCGQCGSNLVWNNTPCRACGKKEQK